MPRQRELTIRIQVNGQTPALEKALIDGIRISLAEMPGEPRPSLQIAQAESEMIPLAEDKEE